MTVFAAKVKGHQLAKATVISCEMMDEAQNDYFHKSRGAGGTDNGHLRGKRWLKSNKTA